MFINDYSKISTQQLLIQKTELEKQVGILNHEQISKKVILNGLYGACSNQWFRWYSIDLAESVTMSGRLSILYLEKKLNEYLNKLLSTTNVDYIIAMDTDSLYIDFNPLVQKLNLDKSKVVDFLDRAYKEKIGPFIDKTCKELCEQLKVQVPRLHAKRENICPKVFWLVKKKYILNIADSEGVRYKEPKISFKGVEVVRSSTPMVCREAIRNAVKIIMNGTEEELFKEIRDFQERHKAMSFTEVAFPRSISDIEKWYDPIKLTKPKTPIHVRGSLVYNDELKKRNLTHKYHVIRNKDKIKFIYLKNPNPMKSHVIAVYDELPPELELEKYMDYETQFEKSYLDPIERITSLINWKTRKIPNLDKFMKKS